RLDDEHDEHRRHADADHDLEREAASQADGGSGSPAAGVTVLPRRRRNAQPIGSYVLVTTRSLSGMMPLSVMWMCSGHTSVQHVVMLQKPIPASPFRSGRRLTLSSGCMSRPAILIIWRGPKNASLRSWWLRTWQTAW